MDECFWCENMSEFAETEELEIHSDLKFHPSCYKGFMS